MTGDGHAVLVSGADLRELERRWRGTGSVEDEATWLQERVEAGDLSAKRVSLVASLGWPACRRIANVAMFPGEGRDLSNWLWEVPKVHWSLSLRCAFASAKLVLDLETNRKRPWRGIAKGVMGDAAHLLACGEWSYVSRHPVQIPGCSKAFELLSEALAKASKPGQTQACCGVLSECVIRLSASVQEEHKAERRVRLAIRDGLAPWLLGYADPVGEWLSGSRE